MRDAVTAKTHASRAIELGFTSGECTCITHDECSRYTEDDTCPKRKLMHAVCKDRLLTLFRRALEDEQSKSGVRVAFEFPSDVAFSP